ncbi:MAG: filamentous hemagglutinin N-terminal domain-containing protein [Candidatus Caenarcaniphilales bacterium]|nr:filamentous hemagglutinin N-terminal domain-containing protein [Candidatus Caenarcaniphilales bacterium]
MNSSNYKNNEFFSKLLKRNGSFQIGFARGQKDFLCSLIGLATVLFSLTSSPALSIEANSLPTGFKSVAGNVQFSQGANTLDINTSSNSSIVNYQNFNIGQNAQVNFKLPGKTSVILNRVIGDSTSQIMGSLNSNGNVFLVNPNGILFGQSAQINTNSLLASTLSISDEDFLSGNYHFEQRSNPAALINKGQIVVTDGGSVTLLGSVVENHGTINAPKGTVNFAVGEKISVSLENGITMDINIDESLKGKIDEYQQAILNTGNIKADGGIIKLEAKLADAFYTSVINNEGLIWAEGLKDSNGVIELVAKSDKRNAITSNSGNLSVYNSHGSGGKIKVLGDGVQIIDESKIKASGKTGGGEILLGGDYKGENYEIHNSELTYVGENVSIEADAIESGNGGKVITWANDRTIFNGNISVKGGLTSGNGGFTETSGEKELSVGKNANVNALAPKGKAGDWLLDPQNITIQAGGPDSPSLAQLANSTDTTSNFIIDSSVIEGAEANVILEASEGITFSDDIFMNNIGVGLTANAGRDINVNSTISTFLGDIKLNADADLNGTGNINIASSADVNALGESLELTGNTINVNSSSTLGGENISINAEQSLINGTLIATDQLLINSNNSTINSQGLLLGKDVTINTSDTTMVNGFISAQSQATINSDTLTVNSLGQIDGQNVKTVADRITINGLISAFETIEVKPINNLKDVSLGGPIADSTTKLSIDNNDLANLQAKKIIVGDNSLNGDIEIAGPVFKDANIILQTNENIILQKNSVDVLDNTLSLITNGNGSLVDIDGSLFANEINLIGDNVKIDTNQPDTLIFGTNSVNINSNSLTELSISAEELSKIETNNLNFGAITLDCPLDIDLEIPHVAEEPNPQPEPTPPPVVEEPNPQPEPTPPPVAEEPNPQPEPTPPPVVEEPNPQPEPTPPPVVEEPSPQPEPTPPPVIEEPNPQPEPTPPPVIEEPNPQPVAINSFQNTASRDLSFDGTFFNSQFFAIISKDGKTPVASITEPLGLTGLKQKDLFSITSGESIPKSNVNGLSSFKEQILKAETQDRSGHFIQAIGQEISRTNSNDGYTVIYAGTILPFDHSDLNYSSDKNRELDPVKVLNDN